MLHFSVTFLRVHPNRMSSGSNQVVKCHHFRRRISLLLKKKKKSSFKLKIIGLRSKTNVFSTSIKRSNDVIKSATLT